MGSCEGRNSLSENREDHINSSKDREFSVSQTLSDAYSHQKLSRLISLLIEIAWECLTTMSRNFFGFLSLFKLINEIFIAQWPWKNYLSTPNGEN